MGKYKIFIDKSNSTYVYNVDSYEIVDNNILRFYDRKSNCIRQFDLRICEIVEEVSQDE